MAKQKRHNVATAVAIAILLVLVIAVALSIGGGPTVLNGPTRINLTSSPLVVKSGNGEYVLTLVRLNPAAGLANIYVEQVPVFTNPVFNVTLVLDNSTRVNVGSTYANMQIQLDSMSNGSAALTITPLEAYLNETPDYGRIKVLNASLYSPSSNSPGSKTTTEIVTVPTSATTTFGTTTTINQTSYNEAKILDYFKNDIYYPLMVNYTSLYANTRNCTEQLYNSSYLYYYKHAPAGQGTYDNVSVIVPYSMYYSVSYAGGGNYSVTYFTQSHNPVTTGSALVSYINLTKGTILSTSLSGVFYGSNFTTMQSGLRSAATIGNACEIEIV